MPSVSLSDRAILSVAGAEAQHFLQNLVTSDVDALGEGEARPSALLTPQGKIQFDFLLSRAGPGTFRLECRADIANDLARRLTLYRLRAKIEISVASQEPVTVRWQNESAAVEAGADGAAGFIDLRFPHQAGVRRFYGEPWMDGDRRAWDALRIRSGVAESGSDYVLGDAFPHDVLLDQNGGVGFRKGCFVGQEVVSRMQHRGTARRRVLVARGADALPQAGTEVFARGRALGALGTVAGAEALALLRIDRVAEAVADGVPLLAGGVALSAEIPPGMRFTFPTPSAAVAD